MPHRYPGKNGAHKYVLEGKLHDSLDTYKTAAAAQAAKREKVRVHHFCCGHLENKVGVSNRVTIVITPTFPTDCAELVVHLGADL